MAGAEPTASGMSCQVTHLCHGVDASGCTRLPVAAPPRSAGHAAQLVRHGWCCMTASRWHASTQIAHITGCIQPAHGRSHTQPQVTRRSQLCQSWPAAQARQRHHAAVKGAPARKGFGRMCRLRGIEGRPGLPAGLPAAAHWCNKAPSLPLTSPQMPPRLQAGSRQACCSVPPPRRWWEGQVVPRAPGHQQERRRGLAIWAVTGAGCMMLRSGRRDGAGARLQGCTGRPTARRAGRAAPVAIPLRSTARRRAPRPERRAPLLAEGASRSDRRTGGGLRAGWSANSPAAGQRKHTAAAGTAACLGASCGRLQAFRAA